MELTPEFAQNLNMKTPRISVALSPQNWPHGHHRLHHVLQTWQNIVVQCLIILLSLLCMLDMSISKLLARLHQY